MPRQEDIKKLINNHSRRLQILKEQEAQFGRLPTPANLLIEIEDTEVEIEKLQTELKKIEARAESMPQANILASRGVHREPQTDKYFAQTDRCGQTWHRGETIHYDATSGSIIKMPDGSVVQARDLSWSGSQEPSTFFTNWIDISNQIVNPGFEEGFLGWEEDSSVIDSKQAASRSVGDSTEAYSGTHSRKLFLREGGSYIKQIVRLKHPLSAQCQIRLGVHVKMPFRGIPANKWFTLMLITHGGSSDQIDYVQIEQVDTLVEWTKLTTQTEKLDYPIHKLEIHAFTTKGGGAHKGFDKPVWVDDFTIEHRTLE